MCYEAHGYIIIPWLKETIKVGNKVVLFLPAFQFVWDAALAYICHFLFPEQLGGLPSKTWSSKNTFGCNVGQRKLLNIDAAEGSC